MFSVHRDFIEFIHLRIIFLDTSRIVHMYATLSEILEQKKNVPLISTIVCRILLYLLFAIVNAYPFLSFSTSPGSFAFSERHAGVCLMCEKNVKVFSNIIR